MNFPHSEEHALYAPAWNQIRKCIKGKIGIVELLKESTLNPYSLVSPSDFNLDKEHNMSIEQSRSRMIYFARGRFFNNVGTTHKVLHGMLHEKNVEIESTGIPDIFFENCNGKGKSLDDFISMQTSEGLKTCRNAILVGFPSLPDASPADYRANPPKLVPYIAESIRDYVENESGLVRLDLTECQKVYNVENDTFEDEILVRRLDIIDGKCFNKLYKENGGELIEENPVIVRGVHLDFIPVVFFGSEDNTPNFNQPILFDIAHQNLGHFNLDCDNRTSIHYTANPVMNTYEKSFADNDDANPQGISVAPNARNRFGSEDRAEYLQASAENRASAEMEKDEARMVNLGSQIVKDKGQAQTLGAEVIQNNASTAPLKRFAINYSKGFTRLLDIVCMFYDVTPNNKIEINTKFSTDAMTYQDVQTMFNLYMNGGATLDELNDVKRKAGWTNKTNKELKEELEDATLTGESEELARLRMENDNLKEQLASKDEVSNGD